MKRNLLLFLLLCGFYTRAQQAALNGDAITYLGKSYSKGDIIHLGYGSAGDKKFSFVHYGKSVAGVNIPGIYHNANADWSKADVEVLKVYTEKGVLWAKCNPVNRGSSLGAALGNKIFINIQGAADNNEISGVDHDAAGTVQSSGKQNDVSALAAQGKAAFAEGKAKLKLQASDLKAKSKATVAESKEKLKSETTALKEKSKAALTEGKEKIKTKEDELKLKVKDAASTSKEKIKAQVSNAKQSIDSSAAKLKAQANDLMNKSREAAASLKKKKA